MSIFQPLVAPGIRDVVGNRPFSTDTKCLVGWSSPAPLARTPVDPLGRIGLEFLDVPPL